MPRSWQSKCLLSYILIAKLQIYTNKRLKTLLTLDLRLENFLSLGLLRVPWIRIPGATEFFKRSFKRISSTISTRIGIATRFYRY